MAVNRALTGRKAALVLEEGGLVDRMRPALSLAQPARDYRPALQLDAQLAGCSCWIDALRQHQER